MESGHTSQLKFAQSDGMIFAIAPTSMTQKQKNKTPVIERDPNPFMRVSGPFKDDVLPSGEKHYLDLADIALGTKPPERPFRKPKRWKAASA